MNSHLIRLPLFFLSWAGLLNAGSESEQNLSLGKDLNGNWCLDWPGVAGRTYFLQWSDNLNDWSYLPAMDFGSGAKSYSVQPQTGQPFFSRLQYLDAPSVTSIQAAYDADFDGDGVSNLREIQDYALNPLDSDSDDDILPDGWEVAHGSDPLDDGSILASNGGSGMFQGSSLTNAEAYSQGVQAHPNASVDDRDGDGLENEMDAVPDDNLIDWKKTPEASYVLIDVYEGDDAELIDLNAKNEVLFDTGMWSSGQWTSLPKVAAGEKGHSDNDMVFYIAKESYWTHLSDDGAALGAVSYDINMGAADVSDVPMIMRILPGSSSPSTTVTTPPGWYDDDNIGIRSLRIFGVDSQNQMIAEKTQLNVNPRKRSLVILNSSFQQIRSINLASYHSIRQGQVSADGSLIGVVNKGFGTGVADYELRIWGSDGIEKSVPDSSGIYFNDLKATHLSDGKSIFMARSSGQRRIYVTSASSSEVKRVQSLEGAGIYLFSGDGSGLMADDDTLWRNGKVIPLRDLCPKMGDLMDAGWRFGGIKANSSGTYLLSSAGPQGERTIRLLVPAEVKDNIVATGVDNVSKSANTSDPGYQEDFWIMAPLQGTGSFAYENLSQIKIPMGHSNVGELTCANATPDSDPAAANTSPDIDLDGTFQDVLWTGLGNGINSEQPVQIKINGDATEHELPVKVKAMKYRNVKLRVYLSAMKQDEADPIMPDPNLVPTETELENYLNPLFAYQMNTWFDVSIAPNTEVVDWGEDFTYSGSLIEHSDDQNAVILKHGGQAGLSSDYDMHLFLLGHNDFLKWHYGDDFAKGVAVPALNTCWVLARTAGSLNTKQEVLEIVGHEIGHIFFGAGHPDQPDPLKRGVAPLVGTDHAKRLMYSLNDADSRLIVKNEWDKAEEWLKTRPRGDN